MTANTFIIVDIVATLRLGPTSTTRHAIGGHPADAARSGPAARRSAPVLHVHAGQPQDNQTVLFDASASTGSIVDYQWSFGDGGRALAG